VRVDIVTRATEEGAWREVRRGLENLDAPQLERYRQQQARIGDSVGGQRQSTFRPKTISDYRDLIIEPNIWSGFNLLRGGQGQGIVGSYEQVAQRLDDLVALGADAFILASTSHLEEAYRVGEEVLPLVRGRQKLHAETPGLLSAVR